jgi:integrase/recombinase XerD
MAGKSGLCNLSGMRGRRKGGLPSTPIINLEKRSLEALGAAFLARLEARGFAAGGIDSHRWALKQFLGWARTEALLSPKAFSRRTLETFQLFLFRYCSPRTGQPLGINTQLARLGAVRRFFAWMCREGIIPANPAADLDLPRKQSRSLPKSLSGEEIERLMRLPDLKSPFGCRDRNILELFYATGIRRTEMANLDVGDYDPSLRTLLIRRGKGGKSRLLPVGTRAAEWLERYLKDTRPQLAYLPGESALFLSGYGTRLSADYLGNWVSRTMKKAGITKQGSCHLFRHSCATHMLEGGADIRYIQSMLGHARLDTTQIYTHVSITALKEVHARTHPHGGPSVPPFPFSPVALETPPIEMVIAAPSPSLSSAATEQKRREDLDGPQDQGPDDSGAPPLLPPKPPQSPSGLKSNTSNDLRELDSREVNDYGYRYYHPELGRWLSRDPQKEISGFNLYNFLKNNPQHNIDRYGLDNSSRISASKYTMDDFFGRSEPNPTTRTGEPNIMDSTDCRTGKKYGDLGPGSPIDHDDWFDGFWNSCLAPVGNSICADANRIASLKPISCACYLISILDLTDFSPLTEGMDCLCNILTTITTGCNKGASAGISYGILTAADCASTALGTAIFGAIGGGGGTVGGGPPGGIAGGLSGGALGAVIGSAVIDFGTWLIQNQIATDTLYNKPALCDCVHILLNPHIYVRI